MKPHIRTMYGVPSVRWCCYCVFYGRHGFGRTPLEAYRRWAEVNRL